MAMFLLAGLRFLHSSSTVGRDHRIFRKHVLGIPMIIGKAPNRDRKKRMELDNRVGYYILITYTYIYIIIVIQLYI